MRRLVCPEILDSLPAGDARARRSRRDLRAINRVLGNNRWWRQVFRSAIHEHERTLEIGAGDGAMQSCASGRTVDGLDLAPRPPSWPAAARWLQTDANVFGRWADYQAVVGNLVFHHFSETSLRDLGARCSQHARLIAACEPLRARRFQLGFAALSRVVGACGVTRHDGRASISAGFSGEELPRWLGLDPAVWSWSVDTGWFGTYRMIAVRRTPP